MFQFGKSLTVINSFVNDCSCSKSIRRINLRLCRNGNGIFMRGYFDVNERLKIDEEGNIKLQLDPKVEALSEKLIYCDYVERRRLKFGYGRNKSIVNRFVKNMKAQRFEELANQPTYSIALKYLRNDDEVTEAKVNEVVRIEKSLKPVYMPYAATDKFTSAEDDDKDSEQISESLPPLNERYKKLYESYLVAKKASGSLYKKPIKDLETRILEMEMRRPADDFSNIPSDWMTDYEQFNDADEEETWESLYGTSNSNIPVSSTGCGGCGALLQCQDAAIPGYLPSELFVGLKKEDLKNTICQRCHFMKYYNTTLEVTVSPEIYPQILRQIKLRKKKSAVILMIDVTDFPCSIWPDLTTVIGKTTPIFVVGNKVDLLPKDCPQFLQNIERSLMSALENSGLRSINVKHITLVSAKTGYGVERLINKLNKIWAYKGDVYMIGCTNVGKSTLFNALLQSDYCKVQAVDLIQRATTSPWPGTTLNLLKFPILNPVRWRLYQRMMRERAEKEENHAELHIRKRELTAKRDISFATLQERIGRTFPRMVSDNSAVQQAYMASKATGKFGINENDDIYKSSRWCYDTPGVVHPDQVLHLLTTEELLVTLPKKIISPRSFIFKPGQTMFLAGLGRIDLIEGPEFIRITVFASDELPITICFTESADDVYNELLHTEALIVPTNDPERLKIWPSLQSKEFSMEGIGKNESVADILLSSAGWVAITPNENDKVTLKAWTPEGRGIYMRTPALLSKSITLRGARVKSSANYRCGPQVYTR